MKKTILTKMVLLAIALTFSLSCKSDKKQSDTEVTEEVTVEEVTTEETNTSEKDDMTTDSSESTTTESDESSETSEDLGTPEDKEGVTVSYSYTVLGKEVKGSKSFSGTQAEVESAVKKLTDSLKKIDPKIKITTN